MKKLTACPVCGSSQSKSYLKCLDYMKSKETFLLVECQDCQFIFTNPRPNDEMLGEYYKFEDYISHSDTKKGLISKCYHAVRIINIKNKIKLLPKKKGLLLEIGSGTGKLLAKCKQIGWNVIGVEPNSYARKIAKEVNGIELLKDTTELQLKSNSVDAVMMWHVLEHIPNLNESLKKISTLLKTNGVLIIGVPNSKSYDATKYKENWAGYDVPRHLSHFQKSSLKILAEKHGFEVKKIKPMAFDSFYTSLLSEKIKSGKYNYVKGFSTGLKSNVKAMLGNGEYSSLIFILEKTQNKAV